MYRLKVSSKARKFIAKRTPKEQSRVVLAFEELQVNPYENNLDIKPFKGHENYYRLRIGGYRFIYEVIDDELLIYVNDANNRGDIY